MADNKPLSGRIALVTGSSRGIGAATAKALAAAGAHVVLTARTARDLEIIEEEIHQVGGTATIAPMDLTESDSIARLANAVSERWGKLDILVINAAILPQLTPVAQIEQQFFNRALTLNVLATQALLANFDPLLKRSDTGRVIGVTSHLGQNPRAYWGAYGATKAAFDNLLGAYAQEVENISNTRVAILDPGKTRTQMRARAYPGAYGATKAAFDNLLGAYAQEVENISKVRVAILDPGKTRTQMRARAYPGEDPDTVKPPEVVAGRIATLVAEDFATGSRIRLENAA